MQLLETFIFGLQSCFKSGKLCDTFFSRPVGFTFSIGVHLYISYNSKTCHLSCKSFSILKPVECYFIEVISSHQKKLYIIFFYVCSHFILENRCLKILGFSKTKLKKKKKGKEKKQYLQRYKWLSHAKQMTLVLPPFSFGLNIDQDYFMFPCQIKP